MIDCNRYYIGTLFYENLYERPHDDKIFGEGALLMSVKDFQPCSNRISEGLNVSDGNQHNPSIVLVRQ